LPFLPLFTFESGAASTRILNSSRAGRIGNLTFRVMGGKSGKIAARNGNDVARWMAKTARFEGVLAVFTLPWARL
jgi:hypothetical protein